MPYSKSNQVEVQKLVDEVRSGDRAGLAQAITIIESTSPQHQILAGSVLDACLPYSGKSMRIGITGSPGVGKSTFINAFGNYLIREKGKKVAVLAIDPSSTVSHGSILGDKTRMPDLSISSKAFIRPSPSSGDLGGVAARTRETILLCEAAGYDVILVETVGVGQSETAVHQMVDFFLLLLLPGAGDDLQGIKRGIVEMADIILVNKADGESISKAKEAIGYYKQALQLSHSKRPNWNVKVKAISALELKGIDNVWEDIEDFEKTSKKSSAWNDNRESQNEKWFDAHLNEIGRRYILHSPELSALKAEVIQEIKLGKKHPLVAAEEVLRKLFKESD
jgi:GTPase